MVNGSNVGHKRIRRVSLDQFYALVTGDNDAFYKMCMVLPEVINNVVNDNSEINIPQDTVVKELHNIASNLQVDNEELSMAMAVYLLGFSTYNGFSNIFEPESVDEKKLKRLYYFAKNDNTK